MATLREYLNAQIKAKGSSVSAEKAKASKYKSIAAAKKAGALYYTDKNGKVMAAVYASDLSKPMTTSLRPKARPKKEPPVAKPGDLKQPKVTVETLLPGSDKTLNDVFNRKSREDNLPKPRPTEIRLSTKNLNKFLKNPASLTSIEKSRLKKTLNRAGIKIPKGL